MSIEAVRAYLEPLGLADRILECPVSSATVDLAAQGEIKMQPISLSGTPRLAAYSRFAVRAASSMGASTGRMLSMSSGKRTRMSRTTTGQAELMTGRFSLFSARSWRV